MTGTRTASIFRAIDADILAVTDAAPWRLLRNSRNRTRTRTVRTRNIEEMISRDPSPGPRVCRVPAVGEDG